MFCVSSKANAIHVFAILMSVREFSVRVAKRIREALAQQVKTFIWKPGFLFLRTGAVI